MKRLMLAVVVLGLIAWKPIGNSDLQRESFKAQIIFAYTKGREDGLRRGAEILNMKDESPPEFKDGDEFYKHYYERN